METPVTLVYWNCRGRAEKIRHLLEYCKLPYTQNIYDTSTDGMKWFGEDKPKMMELNAAANLPYLQDNDKIICESDAICIYICHKSKKVQLLGRNPDEWVNSATVHGVFKDFHRAYIKLVYSKYENDDAFKTALKQSVTDFEPHLKKLNGLLGDKQFIAGEITWVDFVVADFIQTLGLLCEEYLKPFPKLAEHQKRVWGLPELKDYFSSDRYCERPCNGPSAAWK